MNISIIPGQPSSLKLTAHGYIKITSTGLAVPHYLKYIEVLTVLKPEKGAANPKALIDAYNWLGSFYSIRDKDKAISYLNKTLALDPQNAYATENLKKLNGGTPAQPAPPKKAPIKK